MRAATRAGGVVAGAALAVTLAACGGESEREVLTGALTESLLQDETFADYEITEEEATCVAERTVEDIGVDRLQEVGLDDDSDEADLTALEDTEIAMLGDAMDQCVADSREVLVDAVAEGILEEPDPNFPVTESEATCVAEGVIDELGLSRLIVIGVQTERQGGDQFAALEAGEVQAFTDAFVSCIDVRTILLDNIATGGAPEDVLACLDANITDEDIEALFVAGFSGQNSGAAAERILTPAVEACT